METCAYGKLHGVRGMMGGGDWSLAAGGSMAFSTVRRCLSCPIVLARENEYLGSLLAIVLYCKEKKKEKAGESQC
jgi:hypothetical protein